MANFDLKGGAAKLHKCAGVLKGLKGGIALGGTLGIDAMIVQLSSSAQVWDPSLRSPEPARLNTVAIIDAASSIIDAHQAHVGMSGQHMPIAEELLAYIEVLTGDKGTMGKLTVTPASAGRKTMRFDFPLRPN